MNLKKLANWTRKGLKRQLFSHEIRENKKETGILDSKPLFVDKSGLSIH
ncbi:hypothetical protein B4144_3371 [Bacillus atrophaeus]|nr:hypothetical protein B4144_3371 [Bacillus atrophaeus]